MSGLQAGQFSTLGLQSSAVVINAVCRLALLWKAFPKRDVIWIWACYSKTSIYLPALMVPFKNMQVASCIGTNAPPLLMLWRFSTLPQSIVNELWLSISGSCSHTTSSLYTFICICASQSELCSQRVLGVFWAHTDTFVTESHLFLMQCCPRTWRQDS